MLRIGFLLCLFGLPAAAGTPDPAIAILQQRCGACHGDSSGMSGLKLTSRENVLHGGSRGAAIVPGKPADSLLFQAVSHTGKISMPPSGSLSAGEVQAIKDWIGGGALWEAGATAPKVNWWAFHKPSRPAVPDVAGAHNAIDAFVYEKLRAAKLEPAPEADKLTLLRRACFDLLGLPPTPEQVKAFLEDSSPNAWERVVDSLLAAPRYGEKWARHWLDLVRYGDTAGFEQDPYILEGWRYRDWVIKSFNDDKPYDRFAKEQIAADELYPDDPEARTGTGYYRVGTHRDMGFKVEELNIVERRTDFVDTTSAVFLGLTVGCARCHDHKFDPIPQRDYYRMQAIWAASVPERVFLDYNPARFYDLAANSREFRLRQIGEQIANIKKPYRKAIRDKKIEKLPEEVRMALKTKEEKQTPAQQALVAQYGRRVGVSDAEVTAALSPADAERLEAIAKRLLALFDGYGPPPMAPGLIDTGGEAPRTYVALRGNPDAPGEEVHPGFLTLLGGGEIPEAPAHAKTTGRRKALAEWMASPENPLFARVMVNRIWQYHFGTGLVKTPSDFGTRAGLPTHPELLDWLATEFAARKWSMKSMHKLILMSDTWRRSANASSEAHRRDPANELLSHMNRRRLEAEEIHDAALEVSGELNVKMFGAPVVPALAPEEMYGMIGQPDKAWMVAPDAAEHRRRSIYMLVRRTFQQPMSEAFDSPDGMLTCSRRHESTTAPQSLALLNSPFMMERARALAAKATAPEDAWRIVLDRAPSAEELSLAGGFLDEQTKRLGSRQAAMTELVRSLLNTNEFLYVD